MEQWKLGLPYDLVFYDSNGSATFENVADQLNCLSAPAALAKQSDVKMNQDAS